MSLEIENINPLDYDQWDNLILESNLYSFFHSYAWIKVLWESYGYKPNFFILNNKRGFPALLPFMEVNSRYTGTTIMGTLMQNVHKIWFVVCGDRWWRFGGRAKKCLKWTKVPKMPEAQGESSKWPQINTLRCCYRKFNGAGKVRKERVYLRLVDERLM